MVQKMDRDLPDYVDRKKKGQAALRRLFFRAAEGVGKTCLCRRAGQNGGTFLVDRQSVSARGALEWKVFSTSAGLGGLQVYPYALLPFCFAKIFKGQD